MSSGKKRSGGGLLLDLILTICTGGPVSYTHLTLPTKRRVVE